MNIPYKMYTRLILLILLSFYKESKSHVVDLAALFQSKAEYNTGIDAI